GVFVVCVLLTVLVECVEFVVVACELVEVELVAVALARCGSALGFVKSCGVRFATSIGLIVIATWSISSRAGGVGGLRCGGSGGGLCTGSAASTFWRLPGLLGTSGGARSGFSAKPASAPPGMPV